MADKNIRKRPLPPAKMPENVASIMKDCLDEDPTQRPSFNKLDMRIDRVPVGDLEVATDSSPQIQEASLGELFPPHIVEAISAGRQASTEYKDMVTM